VGISAEVEWCGSNSSTSSYQKWVDKETGEAFHEIYLANPENPSLSSIIHEINECEIHDILTRWKVTNEEIEITKEILQKYWGFLFIKRGHYGVGGILHISHIISPYGCCGCLMPRKNFRVRW